MIFDSPGGCPTLEELVLCDLFRNIDLREMRGIFVPVSQFCTLFETFAIS
jgi:PX domain-containing protein kinase-like protein